MAAPALLRSRPGELAINRHQGRIPWPGQRQGYGPLPSLLGRQGKGSIPSESLGLRIVLHPSHADVILGWPTKDWLTLRQPASRFPTCRRPLRPARDSLQQTPGGQPGRPQGHGPKEFYGLQGPSLYSEALEVEELSAVRWTGIEVILPAVLAQVHMPLASELPSTGGQQAEMFMSLRHSLGASADFPRAAWSSTQAAAPKLTDWNGQGDAGCREVEVVAGVATSLWDQCGLEAVPGISRWEDRRDTRTAAMPRAWPRSPTWSPNTGLGRGGAWQKEGSPTTLAHPSGLRLSIDLCHDSQHDSQL